MALRDLTDPAGKSKDLDDLTTMLLSVDWQTLREMLELALGDVNTRNLKTNNVTRIDDAGTGTFADCIPITDNSGKLGRSDRRWAEVNAVLLKGNGTNITGVEKTVNKGAANGYASLDAGGKVPASELPAVASMGSVTHATGGTVQDDEARTAINGLLTLLESRGDLTP